jgi:hypothetical protein
MELLKITLRCAILSVIFSICFSLELLSQPSQIVTKSFPITFNQSFPPNKLWSDPLNIIDGDTNTSSSPVGVSSVDDDGYYYNLFFQRLYNSNGDLLDKNDYGTIIKVQLKIIYGLFEGIALSRFSYFEAEGLNFRLSNVDIPGTGIEEKVTETIDITSALKEWSFSNPSHWDELLLHLSTRRVSLGQETCRIYEVQLLVTFIQK